MRCFLLRYYVQPLDPLCLIIKSVGTSLTFRLNIALPVSPPERSTVCMVGPTCMQPTGEANPRGKRCRIRFHFHFNPCPLVRKHRSLLRTSHQKGPAADSTLASPDCHSVWLLVIRANLNAPQYSSLYVFVCGGKAGCLNYYYYEDAKTIQSDTTSRMLKHP